jgi:hypothetical protein
MGQRTHPLTTLTITRVLACSVPVHGYVTLPPPPPSPISWASRINPAVSVKINPGHRGICYSTSIPGSAKIVAAQIRELLPDAHCLSDDPPIWAKKIGNMLTEWKRKNRGQTKLKVS